MKNILNEIKNIQIKKNITKFNVGDKITVNFNIIDNKYKNRTQNFDGLVIAKKNKGIASSFTIRKHSFGENTEKLFLIHSPTINSIKILRYGKIRKAKLYYIRSIKSKKYKIKEKINKKGEVTELA